MTTKERTGTESVNKLRARLKLSNEDLGYFVSRRDELLEEYPEQWIAIHRKAVVAHAKMLTALVRQLRAKEIPRGEAQIEFMTKNPRVTIPG
ncbi:MAG: hypothetical protein HYY29_06045 [Chloroflexi bacterium]|nr:hypothetical protein [Chloroflexota bacterium]